MERETVATLRGLNVSLPDLRAPALGYSGGQRQALAFARAMRASSQLLILDEPTAALGLDERRRVIDTVRHLRAERAMSVLLITHNLEEMRELATRVCILRNGRFVGSVAAASASDSDVVSMITGAQR
jgi:ABC-type sugar transport system ATPase subunit